MERLGADGWLGIGWPQAHGGQGAGPIEQFIFFDEVQRSGAGPYFDAQYRGTDLLEYGTEAQKRLYPPGFWRARATSRSATPSLAPGRTWQASPRAPSGREITTSSTVKRFCSLADHADHFGLAVRTDPDAPTQRAVDVDRGRGQPRRLDDAHPGVGDNNISAVYFENVQVPLENLVGTEGGGGVSSPASSTRRGVVRGGSARAALGGDPRFAAAAVDGAGTRLLDRPWVRHLAQVRVGLDCLTF